MTNQTNNLPGLHPPPPSNLFQRELSLLTLAAETRHDPSRFCLALYRVQTSSILQVVNTYDFMSDEYQNHLAKILDEYQYGSI